MNFDVKEIVEIVYQFGALPIMLLVIWKLYIRNKDLTNELVKKNDQIIDLHEKKSDEIREIEKENVGLLHKTLAALRKIKNNNNDNE